MAVENTSQVWFQEPSVADNSFATRGEHPLDWLSRSTNLRAKECRRFLNEHLTRLPSEDQRDVFHRLRPQWDSTFFELIVARLLQELGATLSFEHPNRAGKRPDFTALFPDSTIVVEATVPVFDKEPPEHVDLHNIIESNLPEGWWIGVCELPQIGPNDSKKDFKAVVGKMLKIPPPEDNEASMQLIAPFPSGTLRLQLFPRHIACDRLGWEAPVTVKDHSETRIRSAVKKKRKQARGTSAPVLLAIRASGVSSDFGDFDRALFGRSYEVHTLSHKLESGFRADGVLNVKGSGPPTIAGVLAFLEVNFHVCTAPVLYNHPRVTGVLPLALRQLEQRTYDSATNSILTEDSSIAGLMDQLNFVKT
jgi:hypothetical protein